MPGTATLGAGVIDSLVTGLDEVRAALSDVAAVGNYQWRVYRCVRTWSGARRGEQSESEVATEITPTPRVAWADGSGRLRYEPFPTGMNESGDIVLTEVSLTYTEAELSGRTITANAEVYYKLVDRHGQGMAVRYFNVNRPPTPDRDNGIGWIVALTAREAP